MLFTKFESYFRGVGFILGRVNLKDRLGWSTLSRRIDGYDVRMPWERSVWEIAGTTRA